MTFHEEGIMRSLATLATLIVGLGYVVTTPAYAALLDEIWFYLMRLSY